MCSTRWHYILFFFLCFLLVNGNSNISSTCSSEPLCQLPRLPSLSNNLKTERTNTRSNHLVWDFLNWRIQQCALPAREDMKEESSLVLFQRDTCLARNPSEVLHLCQYLFSYNFSLDSIPPTPVIPESRPQFPWIHPEKSTSSETTPEESKSGGWKERFESLEKFREQLKDSEFEVRKEEVVEAMESGDSGEWINFAGSLDGAKILGTNPEMRNAVRVIDGKKDTFMKTDCKADQWLIVELSNVAKIKVIELTMKELYSPRIAQFLVYGRASSLAKNPSDYPEKFLGEKWILLGEFQPENQKGSQRFSVEEKGWVKYLGFHVLEYHGLGTACTINDISVFGLAPVNDLESLLETTVQEDNSFEDNHLGEAKSELTGRESKGQDYETEIKSQELNPVEDQCLMTLFEDVAMEQGAQSNGKTISRSTSISTFMKMHQDIQSLKGSTAILSKYVDELHVSLMQTIDELWDSQKSMKTTNEQLTQHLTKLQFNLDGMERKMKRLEEQQEEYNNKLKIWMGMVGVCVSIVGLIALRSSYFATKSKMLTLLVYLLCSLNFLVACLNLVSVISPSTLLNLYRLKLKFHPIGGAF